MLVSTFLFKRQPDGRRPQLNYFFGKLSADLSPSRSLGCREVIKMNPFRVYPDSYQQFFNLLNPLCGVGISFQEMALTLKSASHKNAVDPSLKSAH